jgi:hypothetical protein
MAKRKPNPTAGGGRGMEPVTPTNSVSYLSFGFELFLTCFPLVPVALVAGQKKGKKWARLTNQGADSGAGSVLVALYIL